MKSIRTHAARKNKEKGKPPSGGSLPDLARLSHEIRTPLNVLLGVLDLALATPLNPRQQEYFTLMQAAGKSLMTVVNDLLEFSRIESGELRLERIPFSLRALLDEAAALLSLEAARKQLRIRSELSPGLPDQLIGDPARLRQVLVNLLANAIKFSAAGEIVIGVQSHAGKAGENALHFSVADQGPGISPEAGRALFAPFHQADPSTWREHGGSGLGLSIVARLVELMDGRVWLESQPGHGSTFHFTASFASQAPALPPDQPGRGQASSGALAATLAASEGERSRSYDFLLIDDNAMNRQFCEILLQRAGHRVLSFGEAAEALPLLAFWRPDAVLMDLDMPGMDGFSASAAIRDEERQRHARRLPIIALSAHIDADIEQRCREAGMDGCIAKPVDPAAVAALLCPLLCRLQPPASPMPHPTLPPASARRRSPATRPARLTRFVPGFAAQPRAPLPSAVTAPASLRPERPNYPLRRFYP